MMSGGVKQSGVLRINSPVIDKSLETILSKQRFDIINSNPKKKVKKLNYNDKKIYMRNTIMKSILKKGDQNNLLGLTNSMMSQRTLDNSSNHQLRNNL